MISRIKAVVDFTVLKMRTDFQYLIGLERALKISCVKPLPLIKIAV